MIRTKDIIALTEQLKNPDQTLYTQSNSQAVQNLCAKLNQNLSDQKQVQAHHEAMQERYRKMLANISHDLKTPLTVMSGILELIDLESRPQESNQKYLDKMEEKIQGLTYLLNDFFELNKLESRDTDFKMESIDIIELSRKILLNHYNQMEAAHMKLDLDLPDEKLMVDLNAPAFERVLNNLINNAIAYGFEGGVLGFRILKKNDMLEVMVWDRGKGIEEQHYNHVFERLFTLEDSRNKQYAGSGLGLSITKRLVSSLGGSIRLQSVPYHYTEFKLIFPL